jgi:hypothetical protein
VVVDAARSLPAATARSAALGTLLVLSMDTTHRQAISAAGDGLPVLLRNSMQKVHVVTREVAHCLQLCSCWSMPSLWSKGSLITGNSM